MRQVVAAGWFLIVALMAGVTFAQSNPYLSPSTIPDLSAVPSAATTCQNRLGNNAYDCAVVTSFGSNFTDCFQFISPGSHSSHFDLSPSGLGAQLGCSCQPLGSFKNPRFNASPVAFDCDGDSPAYDFSGKATPKKLTGHISSEAGNSYLFTCTIRSTPCP